MAPRLPNASRVSRRGAPSKYGAEPLTPQYARTMAALAGQGWPALPREVIEIVATAKRRDLTSKEHEILFRVWRVATASMEDAIRWERMPRLTSEQHELMGSALRRLIAITEPALASLEHAHGIPRDEHLQLYVFGPDDDHDPARAVFDLGDVRRGLAKLLERVDGLAPRARGNPPSVVVGAALECSRFIANRMGVPDGTGHKVAALAASHCYAKHGAKRGGKRDAITVEALRKAARRPKRPQ